MERIAFLGFTGQFRFFWMPETLTPNGVYAFTKSGKSIQSCHNILTEVLFIAEVLLYNSLQNEVSAITFYKCLF